MPTQNTLSLDGCIFPLRRKQRRLTEMFRCDFVLLIFAAIVRKLINPVMSRRDAPPQGGA